MHLFFTFGFKNFGLLCSSLEAAAASKFMFRAGAASKWFLINAQ
jgi:hypothetical protein